MSLESLTTWDAETVEWRRQRDTVGELPSQLERET